jgi:streptomycin 6-kinase
MTDQLAVPAAVLANIRRRWPDIAESWATHVEAEFRALCGRYQARPRGVLSARYGFVVAVDTPDGPLVLRGSPDPHGRDQAAVAVALADLGVGPQIHETVTTSHGTWTVADRVLPGTPLSKADPANVNPEALFAPLALMQGRPAPLPSMPSVLDWLRDRLRDDQLSDLRPGTVVAPAAERRAALSVLAELVRDHLPALCHGDASSGNIVAGTGGRWIYIDPRGVSGDHVYDAAVLAVRLVPIVGPDIVRRIVDLAQVNHDRLKAWMLVAAAARV